MNQIDILLKQTKDAYEWVNKLVNSAPMEKWEEIPEIVESSISWQTGHLIVSFYYHTIMVTKGHQMDILQQIPMKLYSNLFTNGKPREAAGKINAPDLLTHLQLMQQKSLAIIESLDEKELEKPLEPTPVPHPIARTKGEALDWNIKHTMYHCGQIGILARILGKRFDFGLKRA